MPHVALKSITLFDEPLAYHQAASTFLEYQSFEIVSRAQPLIEELGQAHPKYAAALEQAVTALSKRLGDDGKWNEGAVGYLLSQRHYFGTLEAKLSGEAPPIFEAPSAGDALNWAVPHRTATSGVVSALRQRLRAAEHDLYQLDQGLGELDSIIWNLKTNLPPELHLVPGIDGLIDDVYNAISGIRAAYDRLFVPVVDGDVAQPYIDLLMGLRDAYLTHVMNPLPSIAGTFMAGCTPPPSLLDYHHTAPEVPPEQHKTYAALDALITSLQEMVTYSDEQAIKQAILLGCLLGAVALVAALVFSGGLSIEISGPGLITVGIGSAEITIDLGAILAALGGALADLGSIEIPTWFIYLAAGLLTLPHILEHPITSNPAIDNSRILNTKWSDTELGRQLNGRALSPEEERIAQELEIAWGAQGVDLEVIKQIIRLNPGLTQEQYDLLIQNYVDNGVMPWNVQDVVEDPDNNIRYLPGSNADHVGEHPLEGSNVTPEEFQKIVMDAIHDQEPVEVDGDNNYYRIQDPQGKWHYIDVVVSNSPDSNGMIVTAYEPLPPPFFLPPLII